MPQRLSHRHRLCALGAVAAFLTLFPSLASPLPPPATPVVHDTKTIDLASYADTNSLLMFLTNKGWFAHDHTSLLGRPSGLYFPRDGKLTMIYAGGLWVEAKLGKGVRGSVTDYDPDYGPGPIIGGNPAPDNESYRVFKIRRHDTPETSQDCAEWPVSQGAPVLRNHAGGDSLDLAGWRIPRVMGDQTLWCVYNDLNPSQRLSMTGSILPLGIEVQCLAWADDVSGPLSRTIFLDYLIINKKDSTLRSTRIGFWADPDLGRAGDDLVGCDSTLSLGFAYNNGPDFFYGEAPPAVGCAILSGAAVVSPGDSVWSVRRERFIHNRRALPMTAFAGWSNGEDPPGQTSAYYLMEGKDITGLPQTDPSNGQFTTFFFSGDPLPRSGWIDTIPDDKRILVSTGPVTIAPGDTQEVLMAVVVGQGGDAASSAMELREAVEMAQRLYRSHFSDVEPATLDVLPGLCPNVQEVQPVINIERPRPGSALPPKATIEVAIYGTEDRPAGEIDPQQSRLNGALPVGWKIMDVGTPDIRETPCGCGHPNRDGVADLVMQFAQQDLLDVLSPVVEGVSRRLRLFGVTRSGRRISGEDCLAFTDLPPADSGIISPPERRDDKGGLVQLSNQPNPFNAATVITYVLSVSGPVHLDVLDILGRHVATLADSWHSSGEYQVSWDGRDERGRLVGSGMYFYRLTMPGAAVSGKMVLLK